MTERQLFGEFLVQKNLIKANTILGLLIEQIRSQPSIGEIVFQNKFLTEEQQLSVFRTQSLYAWDYQQACVELGFWNESLAKQVKEKSAKSRLPIGQLIVSKGILSFGELTKALDEFVGLCEAEGGGGGQHLKAPPVVPKILSDQQVKEVLNESMSNVQPVLAGSSESVFAEQNKEFDSFNNITTNKIDGAIIVEFLEVMLKTRGDELNSIFSSWIMKSGQKDFDLLNLEIRAIQCEFESIHAAAKFIRAEGIIAFSQLLLNVLTTLPLKLSSVSDVEIAIRALTSGTNLIWQLRNSLESSRSEKEILCSEFGHKLCQEFEDLLKK